MLSLPEKLPFGIAICNFSYIILAFMLGDSLTSFYCWVLNKIKYNKIFESRHDIKDKKWQSFILKIHKRLPGRARYLLAHLEGERERERERKQQSQRLSEKADEKFCS